MIQISFSQILIITGFFAGTCISLVVFIFKLQTARIEKREEVQEDCPVNKMYTIIETVKNDVAWIKKTLKK